MSENVWKKLKLDEKKYAEDICKLTSKINDSEVLRQSVSEKYWTKENQLKVKFGNVEFYGNIATMAFHSNFIAQCFSNDEEVKSIHPFSELKVDEVELVNFSHLFRLMNGIDLSKEKHKDFYKLAYFDKMEMWKYIQYFSLPYDSPIVTWYIKHMVSYSGFNRQFIKYLYLHPDANEFLNFFKKLESNFELPCFPISLMNVHNSAYEVMYWNSMHKHIENEVTNLYQLKLLRDVKELINAFSSPVHRDPNLYLTAYNVTCINWNTISTPECQESIIKIFPLEDKKVIPYKDIKVGDYVRSMNDGIEFRGIITELNTTYFTINRNAPITIRFSNEYICSTEFDGKPEIHFYR